MKSIRLFVLATVVLAWGCLDAVDPSGPFDLILRGGENMVAAHGGHPVAAAVLDTRAGLVAARRSGTIATDGTVAFEFVFEGLLDPSREFELMWWVDANEGGGAPGACDAPAIDPQWSVPVPRARGDVTVGAFTGLLEATPVCDVFAVDLTVSGHPEFQSSHGGDDIAVRVVDQATGAVRAQVLGQVSATANPPFDFEFEDLLVVGRSYQVDVWIDANTDGGAAGVCDPPANDPQWRIDLGTIGEQDEEESLAPDAEMTAVCPFMF